LKSVNLSLVTGMGVAAALTLGLYSHLTAPFLHAQGLQPQVIGLFFGLLTVSSVLAGLIGGWLADTLGVRLPVVAGQLALLGATCLFLFSREPLGLLLVAVLGGLFSLKEPAIVSLLAQGSIKATRFGFYNAMTTFFAIFAPMAGGMLANAYGPLAAYRAALVPATAALFFAVHLRPGQNISIRPSVAVGKPLPWGVLLIFLVSGLELGLTRPVTGIFLQARFGATWLNLSWLAAAGGLAGALGMALGGVLGERIPRVKLVSRGFAANGLFLLMMLSSGTLNAFMLAYFGANLAAGLVLPSSYALAMEAVEAKSRGRLAGITGTILSLGAVGGSICAGFLYANHAALPLLAAGLILLTGGAGGRRLLQEKAARVVLWDYSFGKLVLWRVTK
jgi:MFS family permease